MPQKKPPLTVEMESTFDFDLRDSETELSSDFDSKKFVCKKAQKLYGKVILKEHIVEFKVFDCKSLENVGLDLSIDFISHGISKFYALKCGYYPKLVREFYAKLQVEELDEDFDDAVVKPRVNGVDIYFDEEPLMKLLIWRVRELNA